MTRDNIAAVLRADPPHTHRLTDWLIDQVARRGVDVYLGLEIAILERYKDGSERRAIQVPGSVRDDAHVAGVLHELGHSVDARIHSSSVLVCEVFAWVFAVLTAGRKWTIPMQQSFEGAINGRVAASNPPWEERRLVNAAKAFGRECTRRVVRLRPIQIEPELAEILARVQALI